LSFLGFLLVERRLKNSGFVETEPGVLVRREIIRDYRNRVAVREVRSLGWAEVHDVKPLKEYIFGKYIFSRLRSLCRPFLKLSAFLLR